MSELFQVTLINKFIGPETSWNRAIYHVKVRVEVGFIALYPLINQESYQDAAVTVCIDYK